MLKKVKRVYDRFNALAERLTRVQEALGRIEARQIADVKCPQDAEFRVFSQWGEDGIFQYLLRHVAVERKIFVEFGVENYVESNTRFLLTHNHWSGLVMDGSEENINYIRADPIYWASNLKAHRAFITIDNINELLLSNGITGDIGLLSVDIDGNDYWVWDAINVISPRIVACEYNSQFGPTAEITIPYEANFVRDSVHYSKTFYGASISALTSLALKKGYSLIASNSAGNNIFFVRNDLIAGLKVLTPLEAYRRAAFREFHDEQGQLTFEDFETRLGKIGNLEVVDLKTGNLTKISDLFETEIF